jgi:hypothetical protein
MTWISGYLSDVAISRLVIWRASVGVLWLLYLSAMGVSPLDPLVSLFLKNIKRFSESQ